MRYCDWVDISYKSSYRRVIGLLYLVAFSLILLQNMLFKVLMGQTPPFSILRMTSLIFINNSIANLTLFVTFYLIIFILTPIVVSGCSKGILKRELVFLNNHRLVVISGTLALVVVFSILRVFYYINGGPASPSQLLDILVKLSHLKHPYFEVSGYALGLGAVLLKSKKEVILIHLLSYIPLIIGAYFEASLIPSH